MQIGEFWLAEKKKKKIIAPWKTFFSRAGTTFAEGYFAGLTHCFAPLLSFYWLIFSIGDLKTASLLHSCAMQIWWKEL